MRALPNVTTINVVGDSHAEATFRGVVFEHHGQIINTETVYVESVEAAKFSENGQVIRPVLTSLNLQRILFADRVNGDGTAMFQLRANPLRADRPTLFIVGDNDLRGILLPQLAAYDYRIPWRLAGNQPPAVPSLRQAPFEQIHSFIKTLLSPYVAGLIQLRTMGLTRIATLSIAPPTTDDGEYQRFNGYFVHKDTRYKAALLMNDVLREMAELNKFVFVDIWEAVTENGYLSSDYYLDGTHLNSAAGCIAIDKLLGSSVRE